VSLTPARKVIISSFYPWNSPIQVSAHHLARQFAAHDWRVLFLANPISPIHLFGLATSGVIGEKFQSWLRHATPRDGGVTDYSPFTFLPYSRVWPMDRAFTLHQWHRLTMPSIRRTLRLKSFHSPDLMIVDSAIQAALVDMVEPRRLVYRVTDANRHFAFTGDCLAAAERQIAQRADAVFYTARNLEPYVAGLGARRIVFAPHGADVAHFVGPMPDRPSDYAGLEGPIAVFVGSLEDWVDVDVISHGARALPHVNFVLIGPRGGGLKRFKPLPNLRWLGQKDYRDLPAYLRHADIGLIPFDKARRPELVNAINPLKLYEYVASGLQVVACRTDELARMGHLLNFYETPDGFVEAINTALRSKRSPAGMEFVRKFSWRDAYMQFVALLEDPHSSGADRGARMVSP
jgi:glycosyltransferase involved in cell wall biosynthesis